jgi:hypothetical protein
VGRRIRRRHDFSVPLGWAALAAEVGALWASLFGKNAGCWERSSICVSVNLTSYLWSGGALGIALTVLIAFITAPVGRGWEPALWAVSPMVLVPLIAPGWHLSQGAQIATGGPNQSQCRSPLASRTQCR